ncbi:MAG: hypothetical protein ACP5O7_00840 [Phycisphaerae bacterium]
MGTAATGAALVDRRGRCLPLAPRIDIYLYSVYELSAIAGSWMI